MKKYMSYRKIALTVLLVVFILVDTGKDASSNAEIEDVSAQVVKAAKLSEETPAGNRMVKRFYGLNPGDYEGVVLYAPKDNMDVNELLIVKLKDTSQSKAVESAIRQRLDTQLKSFEGYGAEQTALLEAHKLQVKGNYIFFMVGDRAAAAQKAFLKSL